MNKVSKAPPADPAAVLDFAPAATRPPIDRLELRRNPPRLLNFDELCIILDVSERHGRHLIAEKKIPTIRLGGRLLFDTAKVFGALEKLTA